MFPGLLSSCIYMCIITKLLLVYVCVYKRLETLLYYPPVFFTLLFSKLLIVYHLPLIRNIYILSLAVSGNRFCRSSESEITEKIHSTVIVKLALFFFVTSSVFFFFVFLYSLFLYQRYAVCTLSVHTNTLL